MSTRYGAVHATERHESALVRHTFLTVAILLSWGCGSTTSPQPRSDAVVVTGLENGRAALLDGQSLKLLRFVGPALYSSGYASISPDSSLLLLSGQNAAGDNAYVVALNTATFELEWSIRFDRLTGAGVTRLFLPQIVGLSPDRRRLYVFPVDSADLAGIAAIDVAAHKIIAFRVARFRHSYPGLQRERRHSQRHNRCYGDPKRCEFREAQSGVPAHASPCHRRLDSRANRGDGRLRRSAFC